MRPDTVSLGGPSTVSKNYSFCSLSVFTTIPDTQKPKMEQKDDTVSHPFLEGALTKAPMQFDINTSKKLPSRDASTADAI